MTNLGTINLAGSNDKGFYDDGTLDNYGTIIQTGTGNLGLHSDNVSPTTLKIEPGASYLIESDSGIDNRLRRTDGRRQRRHDPQDGGHRHVDARRSTARSPTPAPSRPIPARSDLDADIDQPDLRRHADRRHLERARRRDPAVPQRHEHHQQRRQHLPGRQPGRRSPASPAWPPTAAASASPAGPISPPPATSRNSGSLTVGAGSTLTVAGNFTQTSAGTLNVQIGGTPASGQFGQVAVTGTAALAGTFNLGPGQRLQPRRPARTSR